MFQNTDIGTDAARMAGVNAWTTAQVAGWMQSSSLLRNFAQAALHGGICGADLVQLTTADAVFDFFDVKTMLTATKVAEAIQQLINTTATDFSFAAPADVMSARIVSLETTVDHVWVLITTIGIIFMQLGFSMLEAGSIRAGNVRSLLAKNMIDSCVGVLVWWLVGFSVAYGGKDSFMDAGSEKLATNEEADFVLFLQSFAFAVTTVTIVSGAVAERIAFRVYTSMSVVILAIVHPTIARWVWSETGWLQTQGCIDFAGSGCVHLCGGSCAFAAAWIIGPRFNRFVTENGKRVVRRMDGHSSVLTAQGTLMLYFAWFFFNGGSSGAVSSGQVHLASRACVNTALCSAVSMISSILFRARVSYREKGMVTYNLGEMQNSLLTGLVAITAPCTFLNVCTFTFI